MANPVTLPPSTPNRSAPIQFSHQIHTSLDHENLVWKSQILPILRGHGLVGFVDGSATPPPQFLTDSTGIRSINPEFQHWHQQDQLILAWLFNSISQSLLTQLVRCETSAQLWSTIIQLHSSQFVAKILDLKLQLQTTKKGASTCAQFLQKMQALADRLRSIGYDVSNDDLVLYIVQGLGSEYENFITALSMRFAPPSMVEFSSLLFTHEARLLNTLKASSTAAIHLTTQSNVSDSGLSDNSVYYANGNRAQFPNSRGRSNQFRGRGNSRGRGRGRQTNSQEQLQCQICQKWGHNALRCYHRFDIRYTPQSTPHSSNDHINSSDPSPSTHHALLAEPSTSSSTPTA